jgi:hypothetical protein
VADQQPVALAQVGAGVADRRVGVAGLAKHQRKVRHQGRRGRRCAR